MVSGGCGPGRADLYTKDFDISMVDRRVRTLQCRYIHGRVSVAPKSHTTSKAWSAYMDEQDSHGIHALHLETAKACRRAREAHSQRNKVFHRSLGSCAFISRYGQHLRIQPQHLPTSSRQRALWGLQLVGEWGTTGEPAPSLASPGVRP